MGIHTKLSLTERCILRILDTINLCFKNKMLTLTFFLFSSILHVWHSYVSCMSPCWLDLSMDRTELSELLSVAELSWDPRLLPLRWSVYLRKPKLDRQSNEFMFFIFLLVLPYVFSTKTSVKVHHRHHLSLNRKCRWGTTEDFTTSFLFSSLFPTALWDLPNSRLVHSLMSSSHLFYCVPCLLSPFTVPCKMVLARPDE